MLTISGSISNSNYTFYILHSFMLCTETNFHSKFYIPSCYAQRQIYILHSTLLHVMHRDKFTFYILHSFMLCTETNFHSTFYIPSCYAQRQIYILHSFMLCTETNLHSTFLHVMHRDKFPITCYFFYIRSTNSS